MPKPSGSSGNCIDFNVHYLLLRSGVSLGCSRSLSLDLGTQFGGLMTIHVTTSTRYKVMISQRKLSDMLIRLQPVANRPTHNRKCSAQPCHNAILSPVCRIAPRIEATAAVIFSAIKQYQTVLQSLSILKSTLQSFF